MVRLLKEFIIEIKGFRPIEEAIITIGGINIKEISFNGPEEELNKTQNTQLAILTES